MESKMKTTNKKIITINSNQVGSILSEIFNKYNDKRICVVGTTCCGKSYLINKLDNCRDMDDEIFPLLNNEEKRNACKTPWTSEIGAIMNKYVKEKIITKPMYPVFGTVIVDSDLIIYLNINTILLKKRCESRGVNINNSLNMKLEIEKELQKTDKVIIEICY
ncbi:hypothetical protein [Clostridium felsineum]|uniref:hypothetical protein n=1 Tax=Clostridium felsineum TaxID=36839 RepID=UPI00098C078C|nr:hypothetical protein [Clostridium felsineum]URZ03355.1 hypothetical protein CLAUR_034010 [Clostridium felsineum]